MFRIDFNKLRFLVCDDNPHMRRILRTLLHSFGAREVYESEDGATALEMYSHYVPDIVITDWSMPIFDGLELAQMIRQPESKGNPFAPIIMLTGHSEKRRVTVARDAGVTEFLAKPISAKGLYQRILNVVANPRPFIETKTFADHHVITQPNPLQNVLRRVAEKDLDDPVARAEKALAGLSGEFKNWMDAETDRLAAAHAAILKDGFTSVTREELFRAAHDIKGDAA